IAVVLVIQTLLFLQLHCLKHTKIGVWRIMSIQFLIEFLGVRLKLVVLERKNRTISDNMWVLS
ncbi:MAG: hypothetical protein DRR08_31225, partial [Candidatus Parabeggiatoa sp. nov. 2]